VQRSGQVIFSFCPDTTTRFCCLRSCYDQPPGLDTTFS
jgi:hypothetical protein